MANGRVENRSVVVVVGIGPWTMPTASLPAARSRKIRSDVSAFGSDGDVGMAAAEHPRRGERSVLAAVAVGELERGAHAGELSGDGAHPISGAQHRVRFRQQPLTGVGQCDATARSFEQPQAELGF